MRRFRRFDRERAADRGPRINKRIRAREVMVVGADGENLGVMPTDIAIKRAEEAGLDLVEVAPEARPPVCKILDFGKYKYLQKKKAAEAKRNQTTQDLKEVKLRPKTDDHDYDFKLKHCVRFLEAGDKVKVTIMFRGREVIHKDIAIKRLQKIAKEVEALAKVEATPRMEGRTMHMILAPKAGGGGRKAARPASEKPTNKKKPAKVEGKAEKVEKTEKAESAEKAEKTEKVESAEKAEKTEKVESTEKVEKTEKGPEASEAPAAAETNQ